MSAGLSALVIAGGLVLGRLMGRALRRRGAPRVAVRSIESPPDDRGAAAFAPFPCTLGDVVARRAERDEAWLAGALLFVEDRSVAALFIAPEASEDRAIFVREGSSAIVWLSPLAEGLETPGGEPPSTIQYAGACFDRKRRLPVRVETRGTGAPAIGDRAIVAEYAGPGADRVVLVAGTDATFAWQGVSLTEDAYDVLPGGASTL